MQLKHSGLGGLQERRPRLGHAVIFTVLWGQRHHINFGADLEVLMNSPVFLIAWGRIFGACAGLNPPGMDLLPIVLGWLAITPAPSRMKA